MRPSKKLTLEEIKEKTCGSKVKYLARADAREARKRFYNQHREKMSAYLCPFCGFYHIGHKYPKEIKQNDSSSSRTLTSRASVWQPGVT